MEISTIFNIGEEVYQVYKAGSENSNLKPHYTVPNVPYKIDCIVIYKDLIQYKLIDPEVGYGSDPYIYANQSSLRASLDEAETTCRKLNSELDLKPSEIAEIKKFSRNII